MTFYWKARPHISDIKIRILLSLYFVILYFVSYVYCILGKVSNFCGIYLTNGEELALFRHFHLENFPKWCKIFTPVCIMLLCILSNLFSVLFYFVSFVFYYFVFCHICILYLCILSEWYFVLFVNQHILILIWSIYQSPARRLGSVRRSVRHRFSIFFKKEVLRVQIAICLAWSSLYCLIHFSKRLRL